MRLISPLKKANAAMSLHHTTVFHIDTEDRIVSLPVDAALILTSCADVIAIDEDSRLILSEPEIQISSLTPVYVADAQPHKSVKLYSGLAKTHLTITIVQRAGIGATIIVFAPGLNMAPNVSKLTPRQRDVLLLAIKGLRRDRITHTLGISIATIDLHFAKLRSKMGAKTTSEAVAKALSHFET
jgi:DNA-binding CsgD family transcriptional regulator